jgi:membrane associated rhomboid family serine protease
VTTTRRPALRAGVRAGLGIRRTPWLTAVVVVMTAIPSCVQFAVPGLLTTLERTPAGLGGEWWRSVTALLVQDGGVLGTISNLVFLAVIGVIAEHVMSRPRWLVLYVVAGLVGEFAAYAWQPVGAGNSIAICGLAGGLAVLMIRGDRRLPAATPYAQILWAGALVATVSAVPAVLIFVATAPVLSILRGRRLPATRIAGAAVLACGIALAAVQDIHGAALVAGIVIGAVLVTQ